MKLQKIERVGVAVLAAVTVLGVSACNSDPKPVKVTTSKVAVAPGTFPAAPTAADLNTELQKVVDPAVPNEQKFEFMQGVSADPSLPQRLADFYKQSNATVTVTGVNDLGNGMLSAAAQASVNGGQPQQAVVPFVVEDGKWKVQKEWICSMLQLGGQTSPACS